MTDRPARPSRETPRELGFEPAPKMVPWLSPSQLAGTGLRVVLSELFGAYSDKREIEASLREEPPHDHTGGPELWFDFVADIGEAFGPTYTVASLLARDRLDVGVAGAEPFPTTRGGVLVMGGDEVYPTASIGRYQDKTVGPYRAALPFSGGEPPRLYAIPGNHDWYDGLTAFLRVFCSPGWIGGWRTGQSRSYFALQLPHRWWIWGIDIQFDSYIDEPQLRYFDQVVGPHLEPGDSLILASPTPTWVYANMQEREDAYATIDFLERKVIRPRGAEVRLALSGDAHHYARYAQTDGTAQRFTAGGGGAFLSATHHLPASLELPPDASRDPGKSAPPTHWRLERAYPSREESLRLRWRAAALPFMNPSLWAFIGVVYLLYAWMIQGSLRTGGVRFSQLMPTLGYDDLVRGVLRSPLAILITLALARGMVGFTKSKVAAKRWGLGLGHAVVHLAAIIVVIGVVTAVCSGIDLTGLWFLAVFALLTAGAGGLVGCWVLAAYLVVADRFGLNTNELFAAQRNRDWKNFLRLHMGADGVVTVYPVVVDRTPRKWRLRSGGGDDGPWFEPQDGRVEARLVEEPVRVPPASSRQPPAAPGPRRRARRAPRPSAAATTPAKAAKAAKAPPAEARPAEAPPARAAKAAKAPPGELAEADKAPPAEAPPAEAPPAKAPPAKAPSATRRSRRPPPPAGERPS